MHLDNFEYSRLLSGVDRRDPRCLARAISIIEKGGLAARGLIAQLNHPAGSTYVVGVTGPPGVGKSTFVAALTRQARKSLPAVAVLAVDPTSPVTGGAILGDRIRMQDNALDSGVYIRSMANRGHEGGLALCVYDAVRILETAGFDLIVIETVGAGQSELAISKIADTTLLVLMPGSGDDVQALKSGVMEIADIFAVNKADLPGARATASHILDNLHPTESKAGWQAPVELVTSTSGEGIDKIWMAMGKHWEYLRQSGEFENRRLLRFKNELIELVAYEARSGMKGLFESQAAHELLQEVAGRKLDPHAAAARLVSMLFAQAQ